MHDCAVIGGAVPRCWSVATDVAVCGCGCRRGWMGSWLGRRAGSGKEVKKLVESRCEMRRALGKEGHNLTAEDRQQKEQQMAELSAQLKDHEEITSWQCECAPSRARQSHPAIPPRRSTPRMYPPDPFSRMHASVFDRTNECDRCGVCSD